MRFWENKRVVVTGGEGFLGSYVLEGLRARKCQNILVPTIEEFDLRKEKDIIRMHKEMRPQIVIHLAASVGGIGANRAHPGKFFYDNIIMGVQLIEQGRLHKIEKFVAIGTICAYPKFTPVPFKEEDLWEGYPEVTNAPYGLAKKMLLVQSQAYRNEYDFNSIYLLPVNLYGPKDNFSPESSHVIPALIKKCLDAKSQNLDTIEVWGTGKATREFLYAGDATEGILLAAEHYNGADPVNLGTGFEISVRNLVKMIAEFTRFKGKITWDKSKPDGQPKRRLDTSKAKEYFGFEAKMSFREGLKKTIDWYIQERGKDS